MRYTLKEGDFYPELRDAKFETCTVIIRQWPEMAATNWTPGTVLDAVEIKEYPTPAVRITIPESDWIRIMEIYQSHYHSMVNNPGVNAAWEQYKMMVHLTR